MAKKKEFIGGLVDSFFVFDSNNQKILSSFYDFESNELSYSQLDDTLINSLDNLSLGETDIVLYNNLYQRRWTDPIMTVRPDISYDIGYNEPVFSGEKMKSLRDDLPSIAGGIKTPILEKSSLENLLSLSSRGNNFSTDLFYLDISNGSLSPVEEKYIREFLLSKNDLSKLFERKSIAELNLQETSSIDINPEKNNQRNNSSYRTLFLEPKEL